MVGLQLPMVAVVPRLITAAIASCCLAVPTASVYPENQYTPTQLANAQVIIDAASALHLGTRAAVLGVTAALGESNLQNLDYGDNALNPDGTVSDSVGIFQQQHWWGTLSQRLDPTTAATSFFLALEAVPDWSHLRPTAAIHDVQQNACSDYYTQCYMAAVRLIVSLSRTPSPIRQVPLTSAAVPSGPDSAGSKPPTVPPINFGDIGTEISNALLSDLSAAAGSG